MLIYQYDVAGVSYEASQDVTYLRQWINLHSCRLGLPTSVRYDARNPGNSMVISEGWMGLDSKRYDPRMLVESRASPPGRDAFKLSENQPNQRFPTAARTI